MSLQTMDALKALISKMTGTPVNEIEANIIPQAIEQITAAYNGGSGGGVGAELFDNTKGLDFSQNKAAVKVDGDTIGFDENGALKANVEAGNATDNIMCEFVHEAQYVACVGAEFNIYFDNICKTKNNANIYFSASSSDTKVSISVFEERMSITPTSAMVGMSTITVKAIRKNSGTVIAQTTFILKVIAKTTLARSVRVMLIGDSITNGGWNYQLPNMMDIKFYGTLGEDPRKHEGRVSWTAKHYCTSAEYNTYPNPFYNAQKTGNSKFDFAYYVANHPQFADVDYVNIMLGRNDGYTAECVSYIKSMVDSILSYNDNIRVTVSFGYQRGYQLWEKDRYYITYTARNAIFVFDRLLHDTFDSYERVDLIPTFVNSDNIYDHGEKNRSVSSRNIDFVYPVYVRDAVHFLPRGYYKIGDVFYNYINALTAKYPLSEEIIDDGVNKTALNEALSNANTLKTNTSISTDGTDVPSNVYWCTQSDYDTYSSTITTAQGVYDNSDATQEDVDGATTALNNATTTFNSARQMGSASPSIIPPVKKQYYVLLHNITKDKYLYIAYNYGSYVPTASRIIQKGDTSQTFISFTMTGTVGSYGWLQYTSNDGVSWSDATEIKNANQWDITSAIAYNDTYEVIEKKYATA